MLINDCLIYTREYYSNEALATIIITHGIAEHSGRFNDVASKLKDKGFNVITYDIRGHGQSQGKRGSIKSYKTFITDLNQIVKKAKEMNLPIYLIGHSLGGIITNLYSLNYHDIDGTIIISSPTNYLKNTGFLKTRIHKLFGFIKIKTNFRDSNLSHSAHNINDPLNLQYFRLSLAGEVMYKGIKSLVKDLPNNKTPTLVLHGSKDLIVPVELSNEGFNTNGSKDKKFIEYKLSKHDLLHDIEKDQVLKDIIKWISERL